MDKLKAAKSYVSEFFRNANGYTSEQMFSVFETLEGLIDAELARQVPDDVQAAIDERMALTDLETSYSCDASLDRLYLETPVLLKSVATAIAALRQYRKPEPDCEVERAVKEVRCLCGDYVGVFESKAVFCSNCGCYLKPCGRPLGGK